MIEYEKNRSDIKDYIYHQTDTNLNFGMHLHNSFEFIYVYEGVLSIFIEDKFFDITSGSAALILPNQVHSYTTKGSSKSYLCVFSSFYLYEYYQKTKDFSAVNPVFPFLKFEYIIPDLQTEGGYYHLKSCFYRILSSFTDQIEYISRNKKLHNLVDKVIHYIENNFTEDVSLSRLAKELGYDYNYLSSMLKHTLHVNFPSLVNEYRINLAQNLLQNSEFSITEIARQCGYDSVRSFNRNFLKLIGKSPKDYKKLKKTYSHSFIVQRHL